MLYAHPKLELFILFENMTKQFNLLHRLALLGSDLNSLTQSAILLKKRGLAYKERLEKSCLDLEKAENEVYMLKILEFAING